MPSHSRRDPMLPNLPSVDSLKKQSLAEKIEQARKARGIKTVWERFGDRAESGVEKANPEKE